MLSLSKKTSFAQSLPTINDVVVDRKVVLLRVDLNVPIIDGQVADDSRILSIIPLIKELSYRESKIVLASHYGRPNHQDVDCPFLPIVLRRLEKILDLPVQYLQIPLRDTLRLTEAIGQIPHGGIALLPNLRLDHRETVNDQGMALQLAAMSNVYINEAFSCSHRQHTSIVGIPELIPSAAGFNFVDEINKLNSIPRHRDTLVIIGGSKMTTKLSALKELVQMVDHIFVGGAIANTFLHCIGYNVGNSMYEQSCHDVVQEILSLAQEYKCNLIIPQDVMVCKKIQPHAVIIQKPIAQLDADDIIVDIGAGTIDSLDTILQQVGVVICNGPLGIYEVPSFGNSSISLLRKIATLTRNHKLISCAGGGDMNACLNIANSSHDFTFISNAGGAFLDFMISRTLPGIEALIKNKSCYSS